MQIQASQPANGKRSLGPAALKVRPTSGNTSSQPGVRPGAIANSSIPPQPARKSFQAISASPPQWQQLPGQSPEALERVLAAIGNNNWQALEKARTDHPDFNIGQDDLMRYAVQAEAGGIVLCLQGQGVDPFGPDVEASSFYAALRSAKHELVLHMLDYERIVNRQALRNLGPYLELALDNNDHAASTWLLEFSLTEKLGMPFELLRDAIAAGNVRRVELLMTHPSLADTISYEAERSILHYAITKGGADTVGFLLTRKSGSERAACLCRKHESSRNTILHLAASSGNLEKLRLVLDFDPGMRNGKDTINAKNRAGETPLALALKAGQFDLADLLLNSGARPLGSRAGY